MKRRDFCQAAMAAGVAATVPASSVMAALKQEMTRVVSDLPAVTTSGGEIVLEKAAIEELQGSLRGNLLMPGNAGYDNARALWNAMIDTYPLQSPLPAKETCLSRCEVEAIVSPGSRSAKVA